MLVREIMHGPVVTADVGTSLAEAYRTLQVRAIRHLPVVRDGALIGIVTDRDLRLATSNLLPHPFSAEDRVEAVMTPDPITTTPLDPVEEAARLMRDRKIGCLPVLEGDVLVGIITGPDLLDAIIRLTGLHRPSGRLAVDLEGLPGELARLTELVERQGVTIHSILSYPDVGDRPRMILRVDSLNTRALAERLREGGFTVAWPPSKTWSL